MIFKQLSNEYKKRFEFLYESRNRPLIITGSGHSLTTIEYSCYPNNPLIVRTNNFFFEEEYYLGKTLDYVLFHSYPERIFYSYFDTLMEILARREYKLHHRYSYASFSKVPQVRYLSPFLQESVYSSVTDISKIYSFSPFIHSLLEKEYRPTSGMYALAAMILLGFTEIYLIGIDLYEKCIENSFYPFDISEKVHYLNSINESEESFRKFTPIKPNKTNNHKNGEHTLYTEELIINWAKEHATLYSLSKQSTLLNTLIPLAPDTNNKKTIKEAKHKDFIKDYTSSPTPEPESEEEIFSERKKKNSSKIKEKWKNSIKKRCKFF